MFPVWDTLLVSKCTQIYGLPICIDLYCIVVVLVVGISATMCHSAEKIPAKEGCQS